MIATRDLVILPSDIIVRGPKVERPSARSEGHWQHRRCWIGCQGKKAETCRWMGHVADLYLLIVCVGIPIVDPSTVNRT